MVQTVVLRELWSLLNDGPDLIVVGVELKCVLDKPSKIPL